jgi:hypothetical protein
LYHPKKQGLKAGKMEVLHIHYSRSASGLTLRRWNECCFEVKKYPPESQRADSMSEHNLPPYYFHKGNFTIATDTGFISSAKYI